jgi:alginate O-acetyltransferase complex protein AlgI
MLFNSFPFLILFLITFSIYYIPQLRKLQVFILVAASLIFYSWDAPALLILLLLSIGLNSIISYQVAYVDRPKQIVWASTGVIINLAILILFKYGALLTNLFISSFADPAQVGSGVVAILLHLPLPIGISFYTFEGISLLIDILRGHDRQQASFVDRSLTQHLLKSSLFIAFFPHLIAGPILKASNFYPQIKPKYLKEVDWNLVFRSLTIGYFLKMVVADNLKDYTFWIAFPYYQTLSTATGLVMLFGYSIQIFADFAGYSLIAIGLGLALGYQLPQNFNFPYLSRSITEFWTRWHISLSSWLRDYLYISLGGNRKGKIRTYINLMVVMLLGGLWHGAAWSYAVWGGFHGTALVIERFCKNNIELNFQQGRSKWQQRLLNILSTLAVFSFVSLGWLLFKLSDFSQALDFLNSMVKNIRLPVNHIYVELIIVFSLPVICYHLMSLKHTSDTFKSYVSKHHRSWQIFKNTLLGIMLALIVLNSGNSKEFIYFQF